MIKKITENGEITYDTETLMYTVWDETYTYAVCTTQYPKVAEVALRAYAFYYLDGAVLDVGGMQID